jgi:hypothetical protein
LTRNKLAYNEPITEEDTKETKKSRSWVGLVSGLSFKPNFQNGGLINLASQMQELSANDANFTTQRGPQVYKVLKGQ